MVALTKTGLYRQWLAAFIATIGVFTSGMTLGWPSPTLPKLLRAHARIHLDLDQVSWMISLLYIGSNFSPVPAGYLMNRYGRKRTLVALSTLSLGSWSLLLVAQGPLLLYLARFLTGLWTGIVFTLVPVYLSEIAEPRVRGALNTLFPFMLYLGIMFEYSIGPFVSYSTLILASGALPFLFIVTFVWMPESPYFYLVRGKRAEADRSLQWLRASDNVNDELDSIAQAVQEQMKNRGRFIDLVNTAGNRKAFIITQVLAVVQRMSGISVILAYVSTTLPNTGPLEPNDCAIIVCTIWIVFGLWSTVLVDRLGRRPLLLVSTAGCAISMLVAGTWFYLDTNTSWDARRLDWVPFAAFLLYGVFYPIGIGAVPGIVQGEMFPANTKGLASAITAIVLSVVSFLTNKIYFTLAESIGMYANYWIYAACCLYGIHFILFEMIETKGKTLEEIQYELEYRTKPKSVLPGIKCVMPTKFVVPRLDKKQKKGSDDNLLEAKA